MPKRTRQDDFHGVFLSELPHYLEDEYIHPAWHAKVYAGSDGIVGRRDRLRKELKELILARQHGCCLYCDNAFGSYILRKGKVILVMLSWDHFAPFVYSQRNPSDGWVAACRSCNHIKSAKYYDTLLEAQDAIRARRRVMGYVDSE
jgi:5-methylcytosine-specific restriction endonuclease McrA